MLAATTTTSTIKRSSASLPRRSLKNTSKPGGYRKLKSSKYPVPHGPIPNNSRHYSIAATASPIVVAKVSDSADDKSSNLTFVNKSLQHFNKNNQFEKTVKMFEALVNRLSTTSK